MRRAPPPAAFAAAMAGIAVFSMMDGAMKWLTLRQGVFQVLLWRSLASLGVSGIAYLVCRPGRLRPGAVRVHAVRGLVTTGMTLLFFWGLMRVPMAQAMALCFIAPLLSLLLAARLLGEHVGRRQIAGSLLGFAGLVVILGGRVLQGGGIAGPAALLGSALCYAYNIVLMRRQAQVAGAAEVAFAQSLVVAVLLWAAAPFAARAGLWSPALPEDAPLVGLAGALAVLSLLLLAWAYARDEASTLAASEYTGLIWAALVGWVVFGERLRPATLGGAVLIVGGCLVAARRAPA